MKRDSKDGRATASFEEVALSSLVLTESLVELLVEKGVLSREVILERARKIRDELNQTKRAC